MKPVSMKKVNSVLVEMEDGDIYERQQINFQHQIAWYRSCSWGWFFVTDSSMLERVYQVMKGKEEK